MSEQATSAMDGGFGKYVPGFDFLQSLVGQGGAGKPPLSSLGNWVAPTFNVEDLDKRIEELKAVQFWLDQNAKALAATIQALEVQKMTLITLKTMNLSMGDVAQSLGAMVGMGAEAAAAQAPSPTVFAGLEMPARTYGNPAAAPESTPDAPAAQAEAASADAGSAAPSAAPGAVDPVQWWGALSQQFQHIASNAMQDVSRQMKSATEAASAPAARKAAARKTAATPAQKAPARKAAARQAPASPSARAKPKAASRRQSAPVADWPMPTALFQMPGFPGVGEPAQGKAKQAAPQARKAAGASATSASAGKPTAKKSGTRTTPAKKAAPASRRR